MVRRFHRLAAVAVVVALTAFGMIASAYADDSSGAAATATPVCSVRDRLHLTFTDPYGANGKKVVNEQYKLLGAPGNVVDPGTPQHSDHHFLGWYYADKDGKPGQTKFDPAHPQKQPYNTGDGTTTEVPVVAKYDDTYPVTFHNKHDGVDVVEGVRRIPAGETIEKRASDGSLVRAAPLASSGKTGVYFKDWVTQPGGTEVVDVASDAINAPQDLYARFTYGRVVIFDTQGGSHVSRQVLAKKDQLDIDNVESPKRQGYEFSHWSLTRGGPAFAKADTPQDKSFTLYAVWKPVQTTYTVVYMREGVPKEYGGPTDYAIDHVRTASGTTDQPAVATSEDKNQRIEEPALGSNGGEPTVFIYNSMKTAADQPRIKGDGTTVKYVYYDRPRHDIKFAVHVKPYIWELSPNYHLTDPSSPLITKTVTDVVAGFPTDSLFKGFRKYYDAEVDKQAAAHPDVATFWAPYKNNSGVGYKYPILFSNDSDDGTTKNKDSDEWKEDNSGSVHYFTASPYMPPSDLKIGAASLGGDTWNIRYVEVDPAHVGQQPSSNLSQTYDPKEPLRGAVILGDIKPLNVVSLTKSFSFTDEDYVPIRGFKTIEHGRDVKLQNDADNSNVVWGVIRYERLSYPLTFVSNGGPDVASVSVPYQAAIKDYLGGTNYRLGKTVRKQDGAVFQGWYDNQAFTGTPVDVDGNNKMPAHGKVLFAKWVVPKVTVTYHEWDSSNPTAGPVMVSHHYPYNTALTSVPEPAKVPAGHQMRDFLGWYYFGTGGGHVPFRPGMKLRQDYDVYQDWPSHRVGIVYDRDGLSGAVPSEEGLEFRPGRQAQVKAAPGVVPEAGKVLLGWRVKGGGDTVYHPGDLVTVGNLQGDGNMHLQPVLGDAPAKATITYYPNGGQGDPKTVTYPAWGQEDLGTRPTFTRKDYEFRGWGLHSDSGDLFACEVKGETTGAYLPAGHSELYAQWNVAAVTINIKKYGTSGTKTLSGAEFKLYHDKDMTQPVNIPVEKKEGTDGEYTAMSLPTSVNGSHEETYWIAETKAPQGHELMPVPVGFTIKKIPVVSVNLVEPEAVPNVDLHGTTFEIRDAKSGELPASGGPGHVPYYIAGLVLLAGAGLLIRKRQEL